MSVINEMLRDLEKNKNTKINEGTYKKQIKKEKNISFAIIVLLLIVISLLIYKMFDFSVATKTKISADKISMVNDKLKIKKTNSTSISSTNVAIPEHKKSDKKIKNEESIHSIKANNLTLIKPTIKTPKPLKIKETTVAVKAKSEIDQNSESINNEKNKSTNFIIKKPKKDPQLEAKELWREAQKSPSNAQHLLLKAIETYPKLTGARLQLIAFAISNKKIELAQSVLNQGLSIQPLNADLIEWKARLLIADNQLSTALHWLTKIQPKMIKHISYYGLLAGVYSKQKQYKKALPIYQSLSTFQPKNGAWLLGLAIAQQKSGATSAARFSYEKALQADSLTSRAKKFIQQQLNSMVP